MGNLGDLGGVAAQPRGGRDSAQRPGQQDGKRKALQPAAHQREDQQFEIYPLRQQRQHEQQEKRND